MKRYSVKNDGASKEKDFGEFSGDSGITPETGTFTFCSVSLSFYLN